MVRPERFELPTFWFVANCARMREEIYLVCLASLTDSGPSFFLFLPVPNLVPSIVTMAKMLTAVQQHKLKGIVGKHKDGVHEAGRRLEAWIQYRLNQGQEFVVGGYVPGTYGFDSVIIGYYDANKMIYVARGRNGFVVGAKIELVHKLKPPVNVACPFANLPEMKLARCSEGLNAEKMKECVPRPQVVMQVDFLEWTGAGHVRYSRYVGLRENKDQRKVVKEQVGEF